MTHVPYPSLTEFAEAWTQQRSGSAASYAHSSGPPSLPSGALGARLAEILDAPLVTLMERHADGWFAQWSDAEVAALIRAIFESSANREAFLQRLEAR